MTKRYLLGLFSVLVTVTGGIYYFLYKQQTLQTNTPSSSTYSQVSNFPFYPIHEIKINKFSTGTYNTEGYVVKIYACPPCPKGAVCEVCMKDNIVISENNNLLETYTLSDKEMILFANNTNQFELGNKYTFSIRILEDKSTGEPINDVVIVGYTSLP